MPTDDLVEEVKSMVGEDADYFDTKLNGLKEEQQFGYADRLHYLLSERKNLEEKYSDCFKENGEIDYVKLMDQVYNEKGFGESGETAPSEADADTSPGTDTSSKEADADTPLSEVMHFEGSYGGNDIYYDERETEVAIACIRVCCDCIASFLTEVSDLGNYFSGIADPYKKLISNLPSFDYNKLLGVLEAAENNCLVEINQVVDAIKDYADGNGISAESIGILNEWIAKQFTPKTPFGDDPGSGPGTEPTLGEDNPDLNSELDSPIDSDDILVLPGDSGNDIMNHGSAVLGGSVAGASLLADDNLSEASADMDDIQTSLLGSLDGRFIVPSLETTVGATDGVKSSGVVGAAGAVIAAGAALGGKIYYDEKKESDQESNLEKSEESVLDNVDEQKNVDLEEIKTNAGEIDFHVDGVQFKENLFNFDGGDE